MKKGFAFVVAIFMLFAFSGVLTAAEPSMLGVWSMPILKGQDRGKERAQVEVFEKNGVYLK